METAYEQVDFQSLKVRAGALLQLQIGADGGRNFEVEFSGMLRGKAVFVSMPEKVLNSLNLKVGDTCVLSGFNGVSEFVMKAPVTEVNIKPFVHIHLQYQERVDAKTVREEQRLASTLSATAIPETESNAVPVEMVDMNSKGAGVEAMRTLGEAGTVVQIKLPVKLESRSVELFIGGTVRHTEQDEASGKFRVGVEFTQVSPEDKLVLYYLLYKLGLQAG